MRASLMIVACVFLTSITSYSFSADWMQFRGAGARGVAENPNLPDTWSAIQDSTSQNIEWKVDLPGRGWSSPIVVNGRIFITTVVNTGDSEEPRRGLYFGGNRPTPPDAVHQWIVLCLDLNTGDELWRRQVHEGKPASSIHLKNSYASETPVTDGERLYCYFGNVGVFCLNLDGEVIWNKPIEPHATRFGWGTAASPVLHGDRLYLVNDNDEQSYLWALDKMTGDQVWKTERDEKSNWATPYIWQNKMRTELITSGTGQVRSYDLEGNVLWTLSGMSSITIATPYAVDDLLYISSGYVADQARPLYAIRPGASGDISLKEGETSNEWIVWCQPRAAPYNPSTLVYDGRLYVLYDQGFFACYDAKTGAEVYERQRLPDGQAFTASPWAYNGKIYCLNEYGKTFVIRAGDQFEVLGVNSLIEDDMAMATPAMVEDRLLIRTAARLYSVRKAN